MIYGRDILYARRENMCVCVCVMNILRRKKSAAKKKYLSHISHKNESRDDYRT